MKISDKIESMLLRTTNGLTSNIADYKGEWLILYFYPKDATPGCTLEGQDFRDAYVQLQALNAQVLGVSRDSLQSHEKFKCKQQFPFELVSDTDAILCNQFQVINEKTLYGKLFHGIERSTFLMDPDGILVHEWRKVRVKGHVAEVIQVLQEAQLAKEKNGHS